ncbi:hypothetical protein G4V62_05320 [Bacillaceae bacterium SIJ1]|uniref:YkyA family protein n=1 Tax=Litoribacterium kuwaitense TaxID=1398745 RepID=UPI0013EBCC96|nr:YkyA family protein [Litoribacterium kuwaitense]NGP44401.1 hypothetical protein [Litoribacterium kuwaitense]
MRAVKRAASISVMLFVLAACSFGTTPAEDMYEHLEESLALEQGFQEQQEPLVELEEKEQQIYEEIITYTTEEMDKISALAEEGLNVIEEREELLLKEKESMEASEEQFKNVQPLVDELETDELKQAAEELIAVIEERYATYQSLHEVYMKALTLEKEMYTMITDEDMTMDAFTEQVNKINTSYEEISGLNSTFNDLTNQYNTLKPAFYELAELDVTFEKQGEEAAA